MRVQAIWRLIAVALVATAGMIWSSIALEARFAQAQSAATATPRSASTPIADIPTIGTPITYTVKSGDSFNAIARQFNLTPQQLQTLNTITNTGVIRVGQVLLVGIIPFTPTPAPTDTLAPTATVEPTHTPTARPTDVPTSEPTLESTLPPTLAPTSVPAATIQPPAQTQPQSGQLPVAGYIPIDVILVGVVMLFAVIGIIIGFRTQRG